jgi:uncharacterized protein YggT (Ycf19 family)
MVIALFLHAKLAPYKSQLTGNYLSVFNFFDKIFQPILGMLRKVAKPMQAGNGIAIDMSPVLLLLILLVLLSLI